MALDTSALKAAIKNAFKAQQTQQNADTAIDALSSAIGDAMEAYLKTATVTVIAAPSSIVVAGSATTQTNAAAIQITGSKTNSGGIS
jgi:hypothetical protein